MKRLLEIAVAATMLLGVLSRSAVYADAGSVPLPQKVAHSDVIASVEVLSTTPIVPHGTELRPGQYQSRAEVKVLRSIKGVQEGEVYTLEFDNGLGCPNVHYKKGEVCLVFNTKMPNGNYETPDTYYGKYMVADDKVAQWKPGSEQLTPFDDAVSEITTAMQKP